MIFGFASLISGFEMPELQPTPVLLLGSPDEIQAVCTADFRFVDLWVMLAIGIVRYLQERHEFPVAPGVPDFVMSSLWGCGVTLCTDRTP